MENSTIGPLLHHTLKRCLDAGSGDIVLNTLVFFFPRYWIGLSRWDMGNAQ